MKKKIFLRMFCLLLSLLMGACVLTTFASCNKKENNPPDASGENSVTTDPPGTLDENSEEARYKPAAKNFGEGTDTGYYEYVMLVTTNECYQNTYVYDGEGAPREVCDTALYCRSNAMRERYNIELSILNEGSKAADTLTTNVYSQTDFCTVAMVTGIQSLNAAANGYLYDVNNLKGLNLEAPYWDQRIQTEYNINGHLFTLEGDFNFIDDFQTYVVVYNDTVYRELNYYDDYGSPYELASNGKWTYDLMLTMMKGISHEIGQTNGMDYNDYWGFVGESLTPYYLFLGSGKKLISNNSGTLTFDAGADGNLWDTCITALQKYAKIGLNEDAIIADREITNNLWVTASAIFSENRALFRSTALSATMRLLEMEDDYGILPIPAYTEDQNGYYSWVNPGNHNPMSIPVCVSDPDKAALASEYLSYVSRYDGGDSLYYAFYDLLAYARLCRTPDDKRMLQLVFANKTYDIDYAGSFSGTCGILSRITMSRNDTTLSSDMGRVKDSVETKIRDVVVSIVSKVPNP